MGILLVLLTSAQPEDKTVDGQWRLITWKILDTLFLYSKCIKQSVYESFSSLQDLRYQLVPTKRLR